MVNFSISYDLQRKAPRRRNFFKSLNFVPQNIEEELENRKSTGYDWETHLGLLPTRGKIHSTIGSHLNNMHNFRNFGNFVILLSTVQ